MRAVLPGKTSSVFNTPCREALMSDDYFEASDINERQLGVRLSKQTFAIFPKMRELDLLVRTHGQTVIREGHPEVSFAALNGGPVLSRKREADGQYDRLQLLDEAQLDALPIIKNRRSLGGGIDDILDATALLWSAMRWARGTHITYPPIPLRDSVGIEMSVIA
jgi:predicted RNase H-like nuclease